MVSKELKDHRREKRIFVARSVLAAVIVGLLAAVLLARYHYLQIQQYDVFQTLSDKNRMQLQSVVPTRGLIFDRHGRLLAENQPTFALTIVKERVADLPGMIEELKHVVTLDDEALESFYKRLKQRRRPYESVPLKVKLTEDEIARISVDRHRFPGVEVEADLIRHYPYSDLLAHLVGYVGRISEKELQQVDEANYSGTQYYGKLGVERHYENLLHGTTGFQTVEVDARGRALRVLDRRAPIPGKNLTLSLDVDLQAVATAALGQFRGAVVVIEVETGGVLALVSTPSFNPNLFVTGIDSASYAAYRNSLDIPLFNRALRGQYPPGSTIKPFVALAGLNSGTISASTRVWDPGFYQLKTDSRKYRDWKRIGHGWMNLHDSLMESCDIFFYDLAFKAGVDTLEDYLARFGYGQLIALDIDDAKTGVLPSREWKKKNRKQPWFPGDSLNMGIGQGFMLTTPLQLAVGTMVLARKGDWIMPRLVQGEGDPELPVTPTPPRVELENEDYWDLVFSGMEAVMHARKGTARTSAIGAPYRIAGKTGTAQVVGIAQGELYDESKLAERHRDHGLFVGFAPADKPQIALAVVVENGGGGSKAAAPVARKIFDAWLVPESRIQTVSEGKPNAIP
jgi:penicillin-binding protein 2